MVGIAIASVLLALAFWLDPVVHAWVIEQQSTAGKKFMEAVSRWGDWPSHVVAGFFLAGIARLRKNKKWARIFLSMLIACAVAGAAARIVKISVGRARPSVKTEEIWSGPRLSSKYHAFPSGHTASSTAFFAVVLFVNWRIGLACLPIPLLIAGSRIYVGAHYLSDVVAAALLGVLVALLVARLMFREIRNPQSAILRSDGIS